MFGPLSMYFDNANDLQSYSQIHNVNAGDTEFTVPISSMLTTSYFALVVSDYPVLLRFVNAGSAQWTMRTNNVAVANFGSPSPDQCVMLFTGGLPNNYLTISPITGAQSTAHVKILVTGDPQVAYQ